jgi:L,D-transpeptidase catalytic domain
MRSSFFLSAPLLVAALALPFSSPAAANILVSVDKKTQRMTVSVDGTTRYVWPVSTGRAGYDTPNGTYTPFRMEAEHFSREWDDAPMPHSIFFTKIGHAIHGSLDSRHLGSAASHGCVRLSTAKATMLFALVKAEGMKETTVVISGQTPVAGPEVAQRRQPMQVAPGYDGYAPQPAPYDAQGYRQPPPGYGQPAYGLVQQPHYGQVQQPMQQPYFAQQQRYYYAQPGYPPQPPPVMVYRPYNQY